MEEETKYDYSMYFRELAEGIPGALDRIDKVFGPYPPEEVHIDYPY